LFRSGLASDTGLTPVTMTTASRRQDTAPEANSRSSKPPPQVYSSTEHLSTSTPSNQSLSSSSERSQSEEKEERWDGRGVVSPGDGARGLAPGPERPRAEGPKARCVSCV